MPILFLLNESTDPDIPGDMTIFRDQEHLILQVEAIDVRNNEYFAFTSDGRKLSLYAESDYAPVQAEIEADPVHAKEVMLLLKRYLMFCAEDGRFNVDREAVESARDLSQLTVLIPEVLIT